MNSLSDGHDHRLCAPPVVPAQRVRIEKAVRVGNAEQQQTDGDQSVQIRVQREQGEIRGIEIVCSCGRTIRLRCIYEP
jgi:hypothetical protein